MPSPKPMAAEIHEMSGAYVHDPQRRRNSPKRIEGFPVAPPSVETDPVAIAKWHQVCDFLDQLKVLSETDCDLIETYCNNYSRYLDALAHIRAEGSVIVTAHGCRRSPYDVVFFAAADKLAKLVGEFGLSPSSRARLTVKKTEELDEVDKWEQGIK